jgi:probable rRNA maturation factor
MTIDIDVQFASQSPQLPDRQVMVMWARTALADYHQDSGLTIRIVDEEEGTKLNNRWMQTNAPTNVLSFPAGDIKGFNHCLLGDIVICAPVVEREAGEQGKPIEAHYAHMVIHGILHLLGHDHLTTEDAEKMESLETGILENLGHADPYACLHDK